MTTGDKEHATFSPSGAKKWLSCPGALASERGYPRTSSRFADEGTAAHYLMDRCFRHKKPAAFFLKEQIQVGDNSFVVDDEMALNVQCYVDDIMARVNPGAELLVEQKLEHSEVIGVPDQFGTGDTVIIDYENRHLTIADLKYGKGHKVYVEGNPQLMLYGLAALYTYLLDGQIDFVTLVINQPRINHLDEWTIHVDYLKNWSEMARFGAQAALAAMSLEGDALEAVKRPSEDACQWCLHKANCKALRQFASRQVFEDFAAIDDPATITRADPPVTTDLERLGQHMSVLPLVETWVKAIKAEAFRRALAGEQVPGGDGQPMKFVAGKAHRKYENATVAEGHLVAALQDKAYAPREIVSPAVAEKLLKGKTKKPLPGWAYIKDLIVKPQGKLQLVLGSDPRPPAVASADAGEFEDEIGGDDA
jgi:Protein of unknown function (DUF2800)